MPTGKTTSNKPSQGKGNLITHKMKMSGKHSRLRVILPNKTEQNILYINECEKVSYEAYRGGAPGCSPFVNARRIPLKSDGPKSPGGREAQLKGGKKTGRRKVSVTTRQEG